MTCSSRVVSAEAWSASTSTAAVHDSVGLSVQQRITRISHATAPTWHLPDVTMASSN